MKFRIIVEQCCGTPDGMGVTPAGVPHRYVRVRKRSALDRIAAKRGLREQVEDEFKQSEYYGDYSVDYSPIAEKWILRKNLEFIADFDDRSTAIARAMESSGQQKPNESPGPKLKPVDFVSKISGSVTTAGAESPSTMPPEAMASSMPPAPPSPTASLPSPGAPSPSMPPGPPETTPAPPIPTSSVVSGSEPKGPVEMPTTPGA